MSFLNRVVTRFLAALSILIISSAANAQTTIKIVASNTSSGNNQTYPNPGPGMRILAGLHPDAVCMQEFNMDPPNDTAAVQSFITATFGAGYTFYREPTTVNIPNGIISKYPILNSGKMT